MSDHRGAWYNHPSAKRPKEVTKLQKTKQYISIIWPAKYTIYFKFITINSLYMFRALICSSSGGAVYTTIGIFCVCIAGLECNSIPTLLAASRHKTHTQHTSCCIYSASWWSASKCSKHVEAIDRNKLKANTASCWYCCTDILRLMANKTLSLTMQYTKRNINLASTVHIHEMPFCITNCPRLCSTNTCFKIWVGPTLLVN
jgi:hypothetical protein